jgi:hypothetical protein
VSEHEYSGTFVDAMMRAFQASPNAKRLEARLPFPAREIAKAPFASPWYVASKVDGLWATALATLGPTCLEDAGYQVIKDRYGPMMIPMHKKAMAQKSPDAVLKVMQSMTEYAIRGVTMTYKPTGERLGIFAVAYPRAVAPQTAGTWRGVLRFVFEVTAPGKVTREDQKDGGKLLLFEVTW